MNTANSLLVIAPFFDPPSATWVFDDPAVGLVREPFVLGVPAMIDDLVRDIPDARAGFRLLFAAEPFPGHHRVLHLLRPESGGNWYRMAAADGTSMEGWLCPALFHYFRTAPARIHVRAEALRSDTAKGGRR